MRTFRIGLRLGLLAGIVCAVVLTLRARRGGTATDGPGRPTGVHGDWPPVPRSSTAPPASPAGARAGEAVDLQPADHHPHGRVTVPLEAAGMGAPPAVAGPEPGPAEPEVPEPREHLDEETTTATLPVAEVAPAPTPPASQAAPVKKAAKKAPAKKAPEKNMPEKNVAAKTVAAKKAAKKAGAPQAAGGPAWVEPEGSSCPATHPVKAKLSSRLFHLPGMLAYNRTVPDRCYIDAAAAEADGLTRAKR